jgi:formate dehydrogenase subunit delta
VTTGNIEKLVRMANQIGDFYAAMPENEAAEGTAKHLRRFWTPKMIRELAASAEPGQSGLNPTAQRAIEALKRSPP